MSPIEVVVEFIHRINQHDPPKLAEMMTKDHVFIDSGGHPARGRDTMLVGWRGYYARCPDYRITYDRILAEGPVVGVFGTASGTIARKGELLPENQWRTPAAWRAVVEKELIKEWQVYADNKAVNEILARVTS